MRWIQFLIRSTIIFCITIVALVSYGIRRLGTLFIRNQERRHSVVARLRGQSLRKTMTRLGPTFIKLGQVMSSRPDIFEPEFITQIRSLQDKLPPFSFRWVRRCIEEDFGGSIGDHFAELDVKPIAAASVAQVHRGKLKNGDEVAVKVLRPHIRKKTTRDGSILHVAAKISTLHRKLRMSDPVGHLDHFVLGIIEQTDLCLEAKNYQRFRENFEDFDGVVFPRVFPELCSARVLTMEYVNGTKVDELTPGDHSDVALILNQMWLKMCFADGFVHADLHPGNLLITDSREIALFDVGLVMLMTDAMLDQFIDFNRCLAFGKTTDYVNHLRVFHNYLEDTVDWEAVTADTDVLANKFRGKNFADIEITDLFNEIFAIGRKHGIRPAPEYALMIVGAMTAEGLGKILDPEIDALESMAQFLMPIVASRGLNMHQN